MPVFLGRDTPSHPLARPSHRFWYNWRYAMTRIAAITLTRQRIAILTILSFMALC